MNVDVNKIKSVFVNEVNDLYNQETYFVKSCYKFPSRYSLEQEILDNQLRIYFEDNNKIVINGKTVPFCDDDVKRKIELKNISLDIEHTFNIYNYTISNIENQW